MMKKIYLVDEHQKEEFLRTHSQVLEDRSVYTLSSFLEQYPYLTTHQILDYIMESTHVCLDVAKIYLKQICFYDVEKLDTPKGKFLNSLKKELTYLSLLQDHSLFRQKLLSSHIKCYLPRSKDLDRLLGDFDVTYQELSREKLDPVIYEFENKEMEISFVGEKIAELLKKGVHINSIYVCNLDEEYRRSMKRIFYWQNIPFQGKDEVMISMTPLGSRFLELLDNTTVFDALEQLKEEKKENENELYNQIISSISEFVYLKHAKEFIADTLARTRVHSSKLDNVVSEISIEELPLKKDSYVFFLQAISSLVPRTYKDEDYFNDTEKEILGGDTSLDLNLASRRFTTQTLFSMNHLVVTYPRVKSGKECGLTSIFDELKSQVIKGASLSFLVSHFFNQMLFAQEMDDYVRYNTISKEFSFLKKHYQIPYATYDHSFTGISYHPSHIYLSYTSLDQYQKCPFQYYASQVLKLRDSKETFAIFIGNLFHKVLETYFQGAKDWDGLYERECTKYPCTYQEKFFLKKLKRDLAFVIETIEEQCSHSCLNQLKTEEKIVLEINPELSLTFQGKIDKISYQQVNDSYVCVLVDYKTGNALMKKEYMPLGFHLQLPIYLYLVSFNPKVIVGGIYLQNIIPSRILDDSKSTLEFQKKKALKLQGFSHSSFDILEMLDDGFKNSSVIASLKVNLDGNFSKNAKVLYEEDFQALKNLAKEKINETGQAISLGQFQIQPKVIDHQDSISCSYCPYKDLCYYEYQDIVHVNSDKTFLRKEEEHGVDD